MSILFSCAVTTIFSVCFNNFQPPAQRSKPGNAPNSRSLSKSSRSHSLPSG